MAINTAKAFNEKIVLLNVQPSDETPHTTVADTIKFSKNSIMKE
jgi:hypothetical protein